MWFDAAGADLQRGGDGDHQEAGKGWSHSVMLHDENPENLKGRFVAQSEQRICLMAEQLA